MQQSMQYLLKKTRWIEAEDIIKMNPAAAYYYATAILKSRWTEAEPIIKTDPIFAFLYAKHVVQKRWLEAEEFIASDEISWKQYQVYFNFGKIYD